jgi:hypothetical protein
MAKLDGRPESIFIGDAVGIWAGLVKVNNRTKVGFKAKPGIQRRAFHRRAWFAEHHKPWTAGHAQREVPTAARRDSAGASVEPTPVLTRRPICVARALYPRPPSATQSRCGGERNLSQ